MCWKSLGATRPSVTAQAPEADQAVQRLGEPGGREVDAELAALPGRAGRGRTIRASIRAQPCVDLLALEQLVLGVEEGEQLRRPARSRRPAGAARRSASPSSSRAASSAASNSAMPSASSALTSASRPAKCRCRVARLIPAARGRSRTSCLSVSSPTAWSLSTWARTCSRTSTTGCSGGRALRALRSTRPCAGRDPPRLSATRRHPHPRRHRRHRRPRTLHRSRRSPRSSAA